MVAVRNEALVALLVVKLLDYAALSLVVQSRVNALIDAETLFEGFRPLSRLSDVDLLAGKMALPHMVLFNFHSWFGVEFVISAARECINGLHDLIPFHLGI
jgi:hypothetical protein